MFEKKNCLNILFEIKTFNKIYGDGIQEEVMGGVGWRGKRGGEGERGEQGYYHTVKYT